MSDSNNQDKSFAPSVVRFGLDRRRRLLDRFLEFVFGDRGDAKGGLALALGEAGFRRRGGAINGTVTAC